MDLYDKEKNGYTPEQNEHQPQTPPQSSYDVPPQTPPTTPFQTPVRSSEDEPRRTAQTPFGQAQGGPAFPQGGSSYTTYQQWQQQESLKSKKTRKPRSRKPLIAVGAVAAAALVFVAGIAAGGGFAPAQSAQNGSSSAAAYNPDLPSLNISSTPTNEISGSSGGALEGEQIYEKLNDSIVAIQAASLQSSSGSSGSGVIMSADGYIITNAHVVTNETTGALMDRVTVQFSDGSQLTAAIIGADEQTDLAVIKVEPEHALTPAEFGDSDELLVGQDAYAIGSPGGIKLANSMTSGIISAINRDVTINDRVMSLIQTNVTINPGNSGGALINKYGQVVGITSAKLGISYYEGLGFAIPINSAKEIVDQLIQHGYVAGRPSIGITGQNLSAQSAQYNNVPQGVLVASVDSRAYAAQEGLQRSDIITAVDGQTVTTMDEINAIKGDKQAGDTLELTVYRMSEEKSLTLTVTLTDAHDLEGTDPATQTNNDRAQGNQQYYYNNPFSYFFGY